MERFPGGHFPFSLTAFPGRNDKHELRLKSKQIIQGLAHGRVGINLIP